MKLTEIRDLQDIVGRIQSGNFSTVEVRCLLILLRDYSRRYKIVRELGHFVAHCNERKEGILYDHIKDFISKFLEFTSSGGTISIPAPLFDQDEVILALIDILNAEGISNLDVIMFKAQTFTLMHKILEIISETQIVNSGASICKFSSIEQQDRIFRVFFCFGPVTGIINTPEVKIPAVIAQQS